jgi:hypothetical protein
MPALVLFWHTAHFSAIEVLVLEDSQEFAT